MYSRMSLWKRLFYASINCALQGHVRLLWDFSTVGHSIGHGDIRDCKFIYTEVFILYFRDHQAVIILSSKFLHA